MKINTWEILKDYSLLENPLINKCLKFFLTMQKDHHGVEQEVINKNPHGKILKI